MLTKLSATILFLLFFLSMNAKAGEPEATIADFEEIEDYMEREDKTLYVLNFWATWCFPCREEMPYFEKANEEYDDVEVIFVSINNPEKKEEEVLPFIEEKDLQSKVLIYDRETRIEAFKKIKEDWQGNIPATLFIKNPDETRFQVGTFTYESLENTILDFLEEGSS